MTGLLLMCMNLICFDINFDRYETVYPNQFDVFIEQDYYMGLDFDYTNRYWFKDKYVGLEMYCFEKNELPLEFKK